MNSFDDLLPGLSAKTLAAMDFAAENEAREKRHRREMESVLRAITETIDALDDLEQHLKEMQSTGVSTAPVKSVSVLIKRMLQQLSEIEVLPMNAAGGPLDLERHEVVATIQNLDAEENTILHEQRRGYLRKGRLLRRAQVIISKHT